MASTDRSGRPARTGGATPAHRTRRSASRLRQGRPLGSTGVEHGLASAGHFRARGGAMFRDIAEFDGTEAWRGDGALSMRDWLVARCHIRPSTVPARLVDAPSKEKEASALSGALADGRLTLDVFAPLAASATPETDRGAGGGGRALDAVRPVNSWPRSRAPRTLEAATQVQRRFVRFDDERRMIWAQLNGDSYTLVKSTLVGRARRHDHPSAGDPDYERFEPLRRPRWSPSAWSGARATKPGTAPDGSAPWRAGSNSAPSPWRRPHDHRRARRPGASCSTAMATVTPPFKESFQIKRILPAPFFFSRTSRCRWTRPTASVLDQKET